LDAHSRTRHNITREMRQILLSISLLTVPNVLTTDRCVPGARAPSLKYLSSELLGVHPIGRAVGTDREACEQRSAREVGIREPPEEPSSSCRALRSECCI